MVSAHGPPVSVSRWEVGHTVSWIQVQTLQTHLTLQLVHVMSRMPRMRSAAHRYGTGRASLTTNFGVQMGLLSRNLSDIYSGNPPLKSFQTAPNDKHVDLRMHRRNVAACTMRTMCERHVHRSWQPLLTYPYRCRCPRVGVTSYPYQKLRLLCVALEATAVASAAAPPSPMELLPRSR